MKRYLIERNGVSGTMDMNAAAVDYHRQRGWTVTLIGPSHIIIVDEPAES